MLSAEFLSDPSRRIFEYAILVLLSTLGMMVLISAGDLIMLYLGPRADVARALCGRRQQPRQRQIHRSRPEVFRARRAVVGHAAVRRLADLRFHRHRQFAGIAAAAKTGSIGMVFGLVFLLAGLCFKVSAVPFHMWTPDVYEGAPTPVTAFFASAPKVAALAVFTRVALTAFPGIVSQWQQIVVFVAIASMVLGSFAAIGQKQHQAPDGLFVDRPYGLCAGRPRRRHGRGRAGRAGLYRDLCRDDARLLRGDPDHEAQRPGRWRRSAISPVCRAPIRCWRSSLRCCCFRWPAFRRSPASLPNGTCSSPPSRPGCSRSP